ncbi:MAG TPA: tetratricopeptide repeat protein, partial [Steroidobacter sp.]
MARVALAPDDPEAHRHLGVLHAASGARVAALNAGRRACELAPDDFQCWCSLGNVYAMLNQLADAALCFAEVVKIDVRHAEGWHNLGTAMKQLGQREAAVASL